MANYIFEGKLKAYICRECWDAVGAAEIRIYRHRSDQGGDEDIVILGDTNCKARSEDAIQEFVNNGFEDLNEDDIPTYVRGNAPFDRIFVPSSEDRKAFRFSRQYILRSASPLSHDNYLSDHYVVKTTVTIRRDDD